MNNAQVLKAVDELGRIDVSVADSSRCTELLSDVRCVRGWLDAIEAGVARRISELHRSADGAPAADVLSQVGGVSAAEGRRRERRSDTLTQAPVFAGRLADGAVGVEHVDLLASTMAHCPDHIRAALVDAQHDLVEAAASLSPERFGRYVRDTVRTLEHDAGIERDQRQRRDSYLTQQLNPVTGMVEGRFAFHPELATRIFTPLNREIAAMIAESSRLDGPDDGSIDRSGNGLGSHSVDRRRLAAEALGRLISGGHRARSIANADITVIVDAETLTTGRRTPTGICETGDGADLPTGTVARLMCEGTVTPIIIDGDGSVLAAGRSIRHASRTQRRALRALHRTCAVGDCDVPFDRCEIHHIRRWEDGGHTDLDNLVPLCSRHHHIVHDHRWELRLAADRVLSITRPDGSESSSRPDVIEQRMRPALRPTGT